ncbi:MAG: DnaJ domain-containing protein [Rhizobiaceae bacterium]
MFSNTARRPRQGAPKEKVSRKERVSITKTAAICVDGAEMMMPCTVRDMHSQGARMSVANVAAVPDSILLIVRSEDLVARASVAWRKAAEIGVRFIRTGDMHMEEKFRGEQARIYQDAQEAALRVQQDKEREVQKKQALEDMKAQQEAHERKRKMQIMGIDPRYPFGEDELKRAYRQQAMLKHPDQGGTMEAFQELNIVYQALLATVVAAAPQASAISL